VFPDSQLTDLQMAFDLPHTLQNEELILQESFLITLYSKNRFLWQEEIIPLLGPSLYAYGSLAAQIIDHRSHQLWAIEPWIVIKTLLGELGK